MISEYIKEKDKPSIIFDPIPSYNGTYEIDVESFKKNALVVNGKNLWEEFLEKNYLQPLTKIFGNDGVRDLKISIISMPNNNNIGRNIKFSKVDFFADLASYLNQKIDFVGLNENEIKSRIENLIRAIEKPNEELNLLFSEAFKEKSKRLKDVLDKEINSVYFDSIMEDYSIYKDRIFFHDFVKINYDLCNSYQIGLLRLGDFFDNIIDYNELYKLFNEDVFFLMFAKIIYEYNLERESIDGVLDSSCSYLFNYKMLLDKVLKDNKRYDAKISYVRNGKSRRYTSWNFLNEFEELQKRHPETKAIPIPEIEGDASKYKDISLIEKLTLLYESENLVDWTILPKGEGIKKGNSSNVIYNSNHKGKDELIKEVNMRISILENSGYIGTPIKGLNSFSGYYGFVYSNGVVILEKFWENEDTMIPARNCATYVMNIDNFIEMSKRPKIELVSYIKTLPNNGVKRIFHTSINNWQRNLYNEVYGTYRLEDAIEFINGLKNNGVQNEL